MSPETYLIDMDEVARIARERKPKLIVAGWSAYPRQLDFPRFREIADEVGALLMVDMAHFAGLVAAGLHPSPVPHAQVVTTTIHKTIGGGRGGMILCEEEYAKKINSAVFPGQQGGPLEHVIAGKAVALKIAATDAFRERQQRTVDGAKAVAAELLEAGHGVNVLTGGTDVHLALVDLRESELDGKQAEDRLHDIGITVNRNAVPFDPRPPMVTSGLRVGDAAPWRRAACRSTTSSEVGKIIATALTPAFEGSRDELAERVTAIAERYPLYAQLGPRHGGTRASTRPPSPSPRTPSRRRRPPQLEAEQPPQRPRVVLAAALVLVEQPRHLGGAEEAVPAQRVGRQHVARERAQLAAQPRRGRDREAALRAVRRSRAARRPAAARRSRRFFASAQHLLRRRQRERELGDDRVEERHAHLERVGHARAVGLHEEVVDEVRPDVDVLQAGERLGAGGLGEAGPPRGRAGRSRRPAPRLEQRRPRVGREDLLPAVMALERRAAPPRARTAWPCTRATRAATTTAAARRRGRASAAPRATRDRAASTSAT